jgi:two-component system NtrC family response regulator/two-component system response regulator PilR (NtrC family)
MNPMDKVLIVDDDRIFLHSLDEGLQKYMGQFELMTVSNGDEALRVLDTGRISVLITALDMPKMGGLDLLSHMRKKRPQVPCVLMVEPESPEIEKGADRKNIFRIMTKPFDANELFPVIMEGLERLDEGLFWRENRR